jgi:hypothetical protein
MGECRYHRCKCLSTSTDILTTAYTPRFLQVEQEVDDDSDVWDDHDPARHGDPLDPSLMEDPDYEDGYYMTCCNRRPYQPGCVVSRHKARAEAKKVVRIKR